MNDRTKTNLEYNQIKELVSSYTVSYLGKQHVEHMEPLTNVKTLRIALDEATEGLALLKNGGNPPIPTLTGIELVLQLLGTGYVYNEQDFSNIHMFLHSCTQLKKYMSSKTILAPKISQFVRSLYELDQLKSEIERCLRHGKVSDLASKDLAKVRKKMAVIEERIKTRIQAILHRHHDILQESIVSMRGDRYVIPIKKEHRRRLNGSVLDESSSGQTVYMEPSEIADLQHSLSALRADEAREEAKVLSYLTGLVEEEQHNIRLNIETVGIYDFLFAKAKYAQSIDGCNVALNDQGIINIREARHPLLGKEMVPLHFAIGGRYQSLIITGPNTGGKTIALKTIGLLTLMVQSGLLVSVQEGSTFAIFEHIAADIGDGQSLEQSLSTFSAHIKHLIEILSYANESTLVLIDEMASGTDPGEGIALSIAILEELQRRGTTVIATTHFNEIKHFAAVTPGFENARMAFDAETMQPLYRLEIGEAGNSYAFLIAKKLGISPAIIQRSQQITQSRENEQYGLQNREKKSTAVSTVIAETLYHDDVLEKKLRQLTQDQLSKINNEATHGESTMDSHLTMNQEGTVQEERSLEIGDRVFVSFLNTTGTVFQVEDNRGNIGVLVKEQKLFINHKRLTLHISKNELYPHDYDMDIVFESKENRKKRKLMSRKHVEGLTIITEADPN